MGNLLKVWRKMGVHYKKKNHISYTGLYAFVNKHVQGPSNEKI